MTMRFVSKLAVTATLWALFPSAGFAEPLLEGKEAGRRECRQTHQIAVAKFRSRDYSMSGPVKLDASSSLHFALRVQEEEISGGDSLVADPAYFRDLAPDNSRGQVRRIFWEIKPSAGKRIVVVDRGFNWKGDWYSFYALELSVSPEQMVADVFREEAQRRFKPMIDDSWTPQQVIVDRKSGNKWLLMQGSQFYALSGWTIHAANGGDFAERCTIRFMPRVREAVNLLSRPAQHFAALLSEALGPGHDEGTLQPTARIRAGAESSWGTAILRPWALRSPPYNNRADVDESLKQWAGVNARRRAVHGALLRQYPRAERALAAHYRSRFNLSPNQARAMARYATDMVFRDYFVFPTPVGLAERIKAERKPSANPWLAVSDAGGTP